MLVEAWAILVRKDNGYIALLCIVQRSYDAENGHRKDEEAWEEERA